MKRNELLNTMRPSKQRKAVEMALRASGVTAREMVTTLGAPFTNRLQALHYQGLATLVKCRAAKGHVAYHLITDENLTAEALRAQQLRQQGYQRMQAIPDDGYVDDDDYY